MQDQAAALSAPRPHVAGSTPRWVYIVVGLLGGHVALMLVAVTFAVRGYGSAGVEPNYYAKAVAWDADRAALATSAALGWSVTLTPDIWQDDDARRTLTVVATDARGQAVTNARVALRMHHAVHPKRVADATLREVGEGGYAAKLPGLTAGLWRVDLRVEADGVVWVGRLDQQLADVVALGANGASSEATR